MTRFELSLMYLARHLRRSSALKLNEYCIFGSAALVIRGIIDREPGDIDVFVSKRVWGDLLPQAPWKVETPNAGDPPILAFNNLPIRLHLFYDWRDDQVEIDVESLLYGDKGELVTSEQYGSWRVATVEEVLRHKEAALAYGSAAVQKHRPDIEACRIHLGLSPVVPT